MILETRKIERSRERKKRDDERDGSPRWLERTRKQTLRGRCYEDDW